MNRLRKFLGYTWAALAIPLVLLTFMGNNLGAKLLARSTRLHVSPWMNGGEVIRTIPHNGYETRIHRAVFDGLVGPRETGFVQVDWVAVPPATALPERVEEQIDYDADGRADFWVQIDSKANQATVKPIQPNVIGPERLKVLKTGRALRVDLKRKREAAPAHAVPPGGHPPNRQAP